MSEKCTIIVYALCLGGLGLLKFLLDKEIQQETEHEISLYTRNIFGYFLTPSLKCTNIE